MLDLGTLCDDIGYANVRLHEVIDRRMERTVARTWRAWVVPSRPRGCSRNAGLAS